MKEKFRSLLDEESIFLEEDVYLEESRVKQVEDDEMDSWESAWMQGYEEAR